MAVQKFERKGRYTLGDKLQQHVAATDHSMCTDRATSCSNTVRRHVAATNHSVCTGESLWKSLSPQRNFVAATSHKKTNQTESVRLVAATKFCCSDKHFLKILQYTRSDLSLRRVASPCCCNLSPSVYRSLNSRSNFIWCGPKFDRRGVTTRRPGPHYAKLCFLCPKKTVKRKQFLVRRVPSSAHLILRSSSIEVPLNDVSNYMKNIAWL